MLTEISKSVSLMSLLSVILLNAVPSRTSSPSKKFIQWILTPLGVKYSGFALKIDPSKLQKSWDEGEGEPPWFISLASGVDLHWWLWWQSDKNTNAIKENVASISWSSRNPTNVFRNVFLDIYSKISTTQKTSFCYTVVPTVPTVFGIPKSQNKLNRNSLTSMSYHLSKTECPIFQQNADFV